MKLCSHSTVLDSFATLWTVVHQAPPSMGFPRQEYWSGLLFPPPGNLPDPGMEPTSLISSALVGEFFTTGAIWEVHNGILLSQASLEAQMVKNLPAIQEIWV